MAWQLAAGLAACALHCLLGASALHNDDAMQALQSDWQDEGPLIQNPAASPTPAIDYNSLQGVCTDSLGGKPSSTIFKGDTTVSNAVADCRALSDCAGITFPSTSAADTVSGDTTISWYERFIICVGADGGDEPYKSIAMATVDASSYGDPHCKNLHGNRFDIQRPGNHSFLVLPRGADQGRANLDVEARVTRRGGLCTGKLFVTSLKLAGRWMRTLGGDVELYAATEMFNSPQVVGLKLGNSSNISLEEFVTRVPKHTLEVLHFRPELPAKLNTHVNTLTLQFKVGPSTVKVGWAHEKLNDGFANWLWLGVSGLGTTDDAGGLLGSDDYSAVQKAPKDVLAACQKNTRTETPAQDAGLVDEPGAFRSWAFAEA